jgi:RecA/RadA recombinase
MTSVEVVEFEEYVDDGITVEENERIRKYKQSQMSEEDLWTTLHREISRPVVAEAEFRRILNKDRGWSQFETAKMARELKDKASAKGLTLNVEALSMKVIESTVPEVSFLVEDFVMVGGITLLVGAPKSGKSTLSKQIIASVAKGREFLGRRVEKASVLFVTLDEPVRWSTGTLRDMGVDDDDPILFIYQAEKAAALLAIKKTLQKHPDIHLVVIDTLNKVVKIDEINDYTDTDAALDAIKEVVRLFPHVGALVLHHSNKSGGTLGSTAIEGGVDIIAHTVRDAETSLNYVTTKARVCRSLSKVALKWDDQSQLYTELDATEAADVRQGAVGNRVKKMTDASLASRVVTYAHVDEKRKKLICSFVSVNPGVSTSRVKQFLKDNDDRPRHETVSVALADLVDDGKLMLVDGRYHTPSSQDASQTANTTPESVGEPNGN